MNFQEKTSCLKFCASIKVFAEGSQTALCVHLQHVTVRRNLVEVLETYTVVERAGTLLLNEIKWSFSLGFTTN